ncbi:MAG: type II toxin-antitoxin system RelE/ParE family toxin [Candidatus Poribacteria bacterium]
MRYQIIYEDDVIEKDFAKLDGFNRQRIIKEVGEKLSVAPNQFGKPLRKKLKGYRRLRIGDYRIIYRVDRKKAVVLVVMVIHRKSQYKGLERRIEHIVNC